MAAALVSSKSFLKLGLIPLLLSFISHIVSPILAFPRDGEARNTLI